MSSLAVNVDTTHHNGWTPTQEPFQVRLMDPDGIERNWQAVEPLLRSVVDNMPGHTFDTLLAALLDTNVRMYLMAINRGAEIRAIIGIELLETANEERHLNISFVSGQNPKRWLPDTMPRIAEWARGFGCVRATGNFRPAFEKLFKQHMPGWKKTHVVMECEL